MDKDLDTLEEALGYFARAFSRPKAWETIQRTAKITIDRPSAHLLMTLCDQNDSSVSGCRLHELAARIGIEAPSVTRTVQRLEQGKLVKRSVDPADHRAVHIMPTRRGWSTTRSLRSAKREQIRNLLSSWSPRDRKQLVRLLHRLAFQAAHPKSNIATKLTAVN